VTAGGALAFGPDADGQVLLTAGERVARLAPAGAVEVPAGAEAIPCPRARLVPGRVNAHTHVYSGLAPLGLPPPEPPPRSFLEILERVWWRLDRALDAAALRAAARFYVAEALLAGTTTLVDHHESPRLIAGSLEVLAEACEELGMRAVLCYGSTERNGGREEARQGLEECRRFVGANARPLVRGLVGLHASFTVSDATAREAGELCRELGVPLHVHLAEDGADVEDARRRGYPDPLSRLLALDALPPGSILAHGVRCDREQVRRAAERGLWFVQNPRSNRGNRVGYPMALGESPRVALGTDGYPAAMEEEAAALRQEAAAHGEPPEVAERRLAAGWELAAERFGLPFAPLAPGVAADFIAREGGRVVHAVVGGRRVVADGRLLTADAEEIRADAARQAPRLWERLKSVA
jgi:cytosine/adenosine deaminase-related metal-dependent hydrolase